MDICGYVDYQYNILNRSLLEAEIEYQHECFETLKKKYNRYITEADDEVFEGEYDNYKAPSLPAILWNRLKNSVTEFFKKITEAMQRWIVKILSYSKKFEKKLEEYFDVHKKEIKAPTIRVYAIASAVTNVIRDWWETDDADEQNKIIHDFLDQDIEEKGPTSYKDELQELLSYKDSIKMVKDCEKIYVNKSKAIGMKPKDAVRITKDWLSFCKIKIKLIQVRATYAAKLILKAAKMARKSGANISEDDIKKMDQDIENISSDTDVIRIMNYSDWKKEEDD